MKYLKYIGQILASIIYPAIFTGILYLITAYPIVWIFSLPKWAIFLVVMFAMSIICFIQTALSVLITTPFYWIVKRNKIAYYISLLLVLLFIGADLFFMWKFSISYGTWAYVFASIVTIQLIYFCIFTISSIMSIYDENL